MPTYSVPNRTFEVTECADCHGEGTTWCDATDSRYEHTTVESKCITCGGTGEVDAEVQS